MGLWGENAGLAFSRGLYDAGANRFGLSFEWSGPGVLRGLCLGRFGRGLWRSVRGRLGADRLRRLRDARALCRGKSIRNRAGWREFRALRRRLAALLPEARVRGFGPNILRERTQGAVLGDVSVRARLRRLECL